MKKILIIEDEQFMREELVSIFQKANYRVSCVTHFTQAVNVILEECPHLVLLDLNLPEISGFEICRAVRRISPVPILVLTSKDQMGDELHALNLGADEYLTKPCHKDRLLARASNLLKRTEEEGHFIEVQGIRLDRKTYTIYAGGESAVLPENQGKIMELLLGHFEQVVSKSLLFQALWGTSQYVDENALQVNMTRLKKNLAYLLPDYCIVTIRGEGYCLKAFEEVK